jgi:hypothetical protein
MVTKLESPPHRGLSAIHVEQTIDIERFDIYHKLESGGAVGLSTLRGRPVRMMTAFEARRTS